MAVTIRFVNAFNAHNLREALATFGPNAGGSDCDYRHVQVVLFKGKREIAAWLRKRFADDDHLGIARLSNGNAAQPVGVLAVEWAIRKSTTLRRLGFPHGIVPQLSAKVVSREDSHLGSERSPMAPAAATRASADRGRGRSTYRSSHSGGESQETRTRGAGGPSPSG